MISIKLKLTEGATLPCAAHKGEWLDLFTSEGKLVEANTYVLIPFGLAMELPDGYEAVIAPRSSTFSKWGLLQANSVGVIDNLYKGDDDLWYFPALATKTEFIPKGTRIAQFRVQQTQPELQFILVDKLSADNRKGLGSTGV